MSKIFISYRRQDSRLVTNRIYDRIRESFGKKNVFKDVDNIPPGKDFRGVLREATASCQVMLVIIGPDWVNMKDTNGNRRLDNPDDFVRLEVETGLQRDGTLVIPVLVEEADMPSAALLPDSLKELAYNNAFRVDDDPRFHQDMNTLIAYVREHLTGIKVPAIDWRWIIGVVLIPIIAVLIGGLIQNPEFFGLGKRNPQASPTTQLAQIATDNPVSTPNMSQDDARATGAAEAYATLTALAPTNTPTITLTPTNTPISSSDIQRTAQAEIFATETYAAQTLTVIAQETQNAVLTEQFIAGSTATYIFQLSLTPIATNTFSPSPTIVTSTLSSSETLQPKLTSQLAIIRYFPDSSIVDFPSSYSLGSNSVVLATSHDRSLLAVWDSENMNVRLLNTLTGELLLDFTRFSKPIGSVAFASDDSLIAISFLGGTVIAWDLSSGEIVQDITFHPASVFRAYVSFSPDNRFLAVTRNTDIKLYDLGSGELVVTFQANGNEYGSTKMVFSPDGETIITGGTNSVQMWDVHSGQLVQTLYQGSTNPIDFDLSSNGNFLWLVVDEPSYDRVVFWDLQAMQEIDIPDFGRAAFSPDSKFIAFGDYDSPVQLWSLETMEFVPIPDTDAGYAPFIGELVGFTPDSKLLVTIESYVVLLWDVYTGDIIYRIDESKLYVTYKIYYSSREDLLFLMDLTYDALGEVNLYQITPRDTSN